MTAVTSQPVQTSMHFLQRLERWALEKPYLLDYVPQPPAKKSNALVEEQGVVVEDVRGREDQFSFAENGFCIVNLEGGMKAEDFSDDDQVKAHYLPKVGEAVKKALNASRVQIYDYTVRKRDPDYPHSTGGHYAYKQPAAVAHVDTTPECMEQMMRTMNPAEVADSFGERRYQSVNVWKPLRGPLRDWPLALCDPRSVASTDLQARDTVKRDSFIETYQLHYNSGHKWYYLSDQMPNEALVFLQADSRSTGMLGVPHAAFLDSLRHDGKVPRESIEVRCLAYFDDDVQ